MEKEGKETQIEEDGFLIGEETNLEEAEKAIIEEEKNAKRFSWKHFKYYLHRLFSLRDDLASHETIKERILSGCKITGIHTVILLCACLIASIGLNLDSIAVIIGAMLISPLMGQIIGISYGAIINENKLALRCLLNLGIQIVASLAVSTIYFLITPIKTFTPQLAARTSPSWFDVVIAFIGGVALVLASTRNSEYSNVIPGVAIATALMPPLCTAGYGLATAQWAIMGKALYLFLINGYFIFLASCLVLDILAVPKTKDLTLRQWKGIRFRMIFNTLLVLVPLIVSLILHLTGVWGEKPGEFTPESQIAIIV